MNIAVVHRLILAATAASGILAGASLDQSIKQLPARHKLGAVAFSRYSQAADLGPGVLWYATLGIAAALLTIAAAIAAWAGNSALRHEGLLDVAAIGAVLHSLTTVKAAPINFSQRAARDDPTRLTKIFDRFERWQSVRCALQTLTFAMLLLTVAGE